MLENHSTHVHRHWQIRVWQWERLTTEEEESDKGGDILKKSDLNMKGLRKGLVKYGEILEYIGREQWLLFSLL